MVHRQFFWVLLSLSSRDTYNIHRRQKVGAVLILIIKKQFNYPYEPTYDIYIGKNETMFI